MMAREKRRIGGDAKRVDTSGRGDRGDKEGPCPGLVFFYKTFSDLPGPVFMDLFKYFQVVKVLILSYFEADAAVINTQGKNSK